MNPELCNICSGDHYYLACDQYNPVAGDRTEAATPSSSLRPPKTPSSCRSCLVVKAWWSYDEETQEMMWMMAKWAM